jgi:hypothetical protein
LPEAFRFEVIKRKTDIRFGFPAGCNNPPIGTVAESQIAVFSKKRAVEFAFLCESADQEEQ